MAIDFQTNAASTKQAYELVNHWLTAFETTLEQGDARVAAEYFLEDSWWRDLLSFTWDHRSFQGREKIQAGLAETLAKTKPSKFQLEPNKPPSISESETEGQTVEAFYTFETAIGQGRGFLRLRQDEGGSWKAWTLLTTLDSLKGHEEKRGFNRPKGIDGAARHKRKNWLEQREESQSFKDRDPQVLVIGSGQAGLSIAARLGHLGIDTLLIEKNARVGDNWRKRYHSLVLHDPIWKNHLPYMTYPDSWPVFIPKDKLADWFEFYASAMELNVWTSTTFLGADYDETSKTWTARVKREDGKEQSLKANHLILASGMAGLPRVPDFEGMEAFQGVIKHSSAHAGAEAWEGKKAVVVGAATSGHDIALAFYEYGADVTMVQRSSTYVINSDTFTKVLQGGDAEQLEPSLADVDLKGASTPILLLAEQLKSVTEHCAELDIDLLEGLKAAGFQLDFGDDGSGIALKFLRTGGGYYINVGASEKIVEGKIKLKQGLDIKRFTKEGLEFSDGSTLEADIVVICTGYQNMRESARALLGDVVADKLGLVWGLDDEGELRTIWRNSGHPRFWFMGGNLQQCRFYSKFLALRIKAIEEGMIASGGLENGV